jgi:hypothetical protein
MSTPSTLTPAGEITSCSATPQAVNAKLATCLSEEDSLRQVWMEASGRVASNFPALETRVETLLYSVDDQMLGINNINFGAGQP